MIGPDTMAEPNFRFVCVPAALAGTPAGWAAEMLREGEIALLADDDGFEAIDRVAHDLRMVAIKLVRHEHGRELQEQTVIAYAGSLALVWVAEEFCEETRRWARDRGPMTL